MPTYVTTSITITLNLLWISYYQRITESLTFFVRRLVVLTGNNISLNIIIDVKPRSLLFVTESYT